jgi:CHAD domain-containing protein
MSSSGTAPSSNVEREVKLEVGLRFSLPDLGGVLPGVSAVAIPDARLRATYVDTHDLRLMRWGITVRHRQDVVGGAGAESEWTVKLPSDADGVALVRRELSWPGRLGPVPAEVANLVRAAGRGEALGPVARLTTQRRRVELRGPGGTRLAEVDDDVVSVLDGRRLAARFREVEIEVLPEAPAGLLEGLVERVTAGGAVAGDDRPKVVRAIGARASLGPDVSVPPLGPDAAMGDVVAAAIAAGTIRIIRHDPGVRLGDDAEHVHQARVGTRRLRSDLRTFRSVLDGRWVSEMRAELGWLAAALGEVRDADVLAERLEAEVAALPPADARPAAGLLRRMTTQRHEARDRLLEVLNSDRYIAILNALTQAAANPPLLAKETSLPASGPADANGSATTPSGNGAHPAGVDRPAGAEQVRRQEVVLTAPTPTTPVVASPASAPAADAGEAETEPSGTGAVVEGVAAGGPGDAPARLVLPNLVRGPWRHLRQAVGALGSDPPDSALHQVRIRAKRLRYAAEAAAPVIGKPARRLASAAADLQGVLGDLNDAVVAEAWLRHSAQHAPAGQALVAGELVARERDRQQASRRQWAKVWKAADQPRLRAWLKA